MDFLKTKLDSPNAWIAAIIAALLVFKLYTLIWVFLGLLIVLPEKQFSEWFKSGATKIKTTID